jgi:hypothetical protein
MNPDIQSIPEAESSRVRDFLRSIFQPSDDAVFISPAQMHWKYWEPRADWTGSRSYAYLDDSGKIVAHAGAWPFALRTTGATVTGVHPIDWAASKQVRGSGALLLRQVRALQEICCCIGGTDVAQAVVQRSGFRAATTMQLLARPLRPVRQALTHQRRNWKLPARLLRNAAWVMRGAPAPTGWVAEPVHPGEILDAVLPSPTQGLAVACRSPALFEYMLKCPTARYQIWLVRQDGEPRGYFLLSFVPGQARVADAWIASAQSESWRALYALAIRIALQDSSVAEITACATLGEAITGAEACGFRSYAELAVMLFDPKNCLAPVNRFHMQMIENDMSFLHGNRIEYIT